MKKVVFIGSRLNVLQHIKDFSDLQLVKLFVQDDSLLSRKLSEAPSLYDGDTSVFTVKEKQAVIDEIASLDFDIFISNGCPIILPVSKLQKDGQLFINIHPTLLPELKGKTPLNGVFMTHQKQIGATMHYMDDGIDTGATIAQQKTDVTSDLDQGLVYKISFDLEGAVFVEGMKTLQKSNYTFEGVLQSSEGSYFNRTPDLQTITIEKDATDLIIDKVKSFGIKGQGSYLTIDGITFTIYAAEKIINDYLLNAYAHVAAGSVAFTYDDKIVVRTIDGMIKIIDYQTKTDV